MSQPSNFQTLDAYFEHKEAFLDSFIDAGSEQELFVSSYIHGHFSVAAAQSISNSRNTSLTELIDGFEARLEQSIATAVSNNELSDNDAIDVTKMLSNLWLY